MRVEGVRETIPVMPARPVSEDRPEGPEQKYEGHISLEDKESAMPLDKAIEVLNKTMDSYSRHLKFTLHKGSGEYMVKVINTKDDTVIREIPPEKVLDMVAYFKEMLGIVVDKFI